MAFGAMVVAILWPAAIGVKLGAPAIVFFGLGFIIPLITIACQLGTSLRIPVTGALLLWAVLLGVFFDNHGVGRRALIAETGGRMIGRPTLESAFKQWAAPPQPVGANGKKTMVLIAVQGGASRAGYWTAVALAQLQTAAARATGKDGKPVDFGAHVFAISSVSGGSVGAVGYAAMLKTAPPNVRAPTTDADAAIFTDNLLGFAGRDALGPALTGMLYSDLLYRFLPLWLLPDRAETLERAWEEAWDAPDANGASPHAAGIISGPFLALAPKDGEPWRPLLIVQGASESVGRRMLTSAVKFTCDEVDADDLLDGVGHDVAASTAILNGARFPWVSPGGTFTHQPCYAKEGDSKSNDHVLDGGYFDNAGAETLREMTRAIRNLPGGGDKDLDIVFILIGYANHDPTKPPPPPPTGLHGVGLRPHRLAHSQRRLRAGAWPLQRHGRARGASGARDEARRPDDRHQHGPLSFAADWRQPIRRARPLPGSGHRQWPHNRLRSADGLDAIRRSQALHREFGHRGHPRLQRGRQCRGDRGGGGEASALIGAKNALSVLKNGAAPNERRRPFRLASRYFFCPLT